MGRVRHMAGPNWDNNSLKNRTVPGKGYQLGGRAALNSLYTEKERLYLFGAPARPCAQQRTGEVIQGLTSLGSRGPGRHGQNMVSRHSLLPVHTQNSKR